MNCDVDHGSPIGMAFRAVCFAVALAVVGCSKHRDESPAERGARESMEDFTEALQEAVSDPEDQKSLVKMAESMSTDFAYNGFGKDEILAALGVAPPFVSLNSPEVELKQPERNTSQENSQIPARPGSPFSLPPLADVAFTQVKQTGADTFVAAIQAVVDHSAVNQERSEAPEAGLPQVPNEKLTGELEFRMGPDGKIRSIRPLDLVISESESLVVESPIVLLGGREVKPSSPAVKTRPGEPLRIELTGGEWEKGFVEFRGKTYSLHQGSASWEGAFKVPAETPAGTYYLGIVAMNISDPPTGKPLPVKARVVRRQPTGGPNSPEGEPITLTLIPVDGSGEKRRVAERYLTIPLVVP
ncbi:MAG: hypothetical protein HYT87_01280 [Nitrospirae bacterium]|nr:hypothetical protein [Nitrospirota bacterium]